MQAQRIDINWHPGYPIFAREQFLQAVIDEYGWLGGQDDNGDVRFVLPYTILKKSLFRFARFRVETIPLVPEPDIDDEKLFLESCMNYFHDLGVHVIIPATTNCVFRTYPSGAIAAPYGSYVIDLTTPEDTLWRNIERITRQNIKTAQKKGVEVKVAGGALKTIHEMIRDTFNRSKLPFMGLREFRRFIEGLGEYGLILTAEHEGRAQSHVVFGFSEYCAYAIYAGNAANQVQGSNKLLYWEAIRRFKQLGVRKYDFVGARVNPPKGSKQEALGIFKRHFGAKLVRGFIWKYPVNPLFNKLYCLAAKLRSGGDIVDAEKHNLSSMDISHQS